MENLKIVKLTASNIQRLVAVQISPEGNLITIGGKNKAGKSTFMNSIAMALGGAALIPKEPIRLGETEAFVEVDLGEIIVTRKFKLVFGEGDQADTVSSLEIKSKDGSVFPSPQAMLNKLFSKIAFDPLAFSRMDDAPQLAMLKQLVQLDTSAIDKERAAAVASRTDLKKRSVLAEARVRQLVVHMNVPDEEVSVDEISKKLETTDAQNKRHAALSVQIMDKLKDADGVKRDVEETTQEIARLQAKLTVYQNRIQAFQKDAMELQKERDAMVIADVSTIREELTKLTETNTKVRANKLRVEAVDAHNDLLRQIAEEDDNVKRCDQARKEILEAVKFPVEGLGFRESEVTFNGLPFKQAATSEQIRVSVAIGFALNPTLKVLLVRDGNLLDVASRTALAEQAAAADAQVFMEFVSETKEGMSVFIEDGQIL